MPDASLRVNKTVNMHSLNGTQDTLANCYRLIAWKHCAVTG